MLILPFPQYHSAEPARFTVGNGEIADLFMKQFVKEAEREGMCLSFDSARSNQQIRQSLVSTSMDYIICVLE